MLYQDWGVLIMCLIMTESENPEGCKLYATLIGWDVVIYDILKTL